MAGVAPFSQTDSWELRQVATILFSGGRITKELEPYALKWGIIIRVFLMCVNHENATIEHLPYSGGIMEQPYKTMQVFELLQTLFIKQINKEQNRKGG